MCFFIFLFLSDQNELHRVGQIGARALGGYKVFYFLDHVIFIFFHTRRVGGWVLESMENSIELAKECDQYSIFLRL